MSKPHQRQKLWELVADWGGAGERSGRDGRVGCRRASSRGEWAELLPTTAEGKTAGWFWHGEFKVPLKYLEALFILIFYYMWDPKQVT